MLVMTEYCYCSLPSDTSLHPVDPQLSGCTSLQAAFPAMERCLCSEKPSLAVCSSTQMSCNKSGSSPAIFTPHWIWGNSFRCLHIMFPTVSDSLPTGEGRHRVSCSVHGTSQRKRTNSVEGEPVVQVVCPQSPSSSRFYPIQSAGRDQSVHLPVPHRVSTGMSPCHHLSHNQQKCGVFQRACRYLH